MPHETGEGCDSWPLKKVHTQHTLPCEAKDRQRGDKDHEGRLHPACATWTTLTKGIQKCFVCVCGDLYLYGPLARSRSVPESLLLKAHAKRSADLLGRNLELRIPGLATHTGMSRRPSTMYVLD